MTSPRVVAILQARMNSARLPGKVLAEVEGQPMLALIVDAARRAKQVGEVVVATTERPDDDLVAETARHVGAAVVRGDVDDVLARFMGVIRAHPCDLVVRLTGDNPLVGGDFIDFVIDAHIAQTPAVAYTDTTTSRTFPYGLSVEIVAPEALEAAHREATSSVDREHVTSFVRDRPERFPSLALRCEDDGSALRWTVDTAGDLANVREVFRRWSPDPRRFGWRELLRRERAFARARGGT